MNSSDAIETPATPVSDDINAKVRDLDELILLLRKSVPAGKTWGRQMQSQLKEADRCVEVLRLTLLLAREPAEVAAASAEVRDIIVAMDVSAAGGRADVTTRSALVLIRRLAETVAKHFQPPPSGG
ncbi:MAG: hypothetical protein DI603_18010 [Roseateles depolymerans]|uniref:Uncharacterized protein n=1 Tax=Roseateles depolymerans TaxID=76731 RepID=A0A2W5DJ09_9BURK|nr:MAG: hypothetical protein DI603_18010 [Roseateles depolymerans]